MNLVIFFADCGVRRPHNRGGIFHLRLLHPLLRYPARVPLAIPYIIFSREFPQLAVHRIRIWQDGLEVRRLLLSLQETHQVSHRDGYSRYKRSEQSDTDTWCRCIDASSNCQCALVQAQQKIGQIHLVDTVLYCI